MTYNELLKLIPAAKDAPSRDTRTLRFVRPLQIVKRPLFEISNFRLGS
jgi:hypothetical protein